MEALRDFTDLQVMRRGVAIDGRVVDRAGRPVAGAEVGWLEADHRDTFHDDLPTTTTDVDGRFHFPHVEPGRVVLQVKARGHAPELKSIEAKAGAEPAMIELGEPKILSGRVVDAQGRPVANAFVNIDSWRGYRSLGVYLKADADGRFRWEDAPADSVLVDASIEGYDGIQEHRASPDDGEIVLTLKRAFSISGKVLDAETKQRIDRLNVKLGTPDAKTGEIAWRQHNRVFGQQGHYQASLDAEKPAEYRLRFTAKGYAPFESRTFRSDEGRVEYDVELTKSDEPQGVAVSGVVETPDGKPLAGAEVAVTYPLAGGVNRLPVLHIEDGTIRPGRDLPAMKTDAEGRFTIYREPDPDGRYFGLAVLHPDYYAEADRATFEAEPTIVARPWGRVEGVTRVGARAAAGAESRYFNDRLGNADVPHISHSGKAQTDAEGRFVLERVPPGDMRVGFDSQSEANRATHNGWSNGTLVVVSPGETVRADVGGRGRPVVARIVPPAGFDPKADYTANSEFEIESDRPTIPYPKDVLARRDESMATFGKRWWASEEGHDYRRNWFRFGQAKLRPDGTIRAEDVPPGEYRLRLTFSADPIYGRSGAGPDRVAFVTKQFVIPPIPGGRTDEPFDLGELRPKPKATLKVGQPVPGFDVPTLDGARAKLEDFRGKYLLLDFWATWCGPCLAELPELKAVWEKHGRDERFAMLSLSLDAEADAARELVAEKELPWVQGFLGEWAEGGVPDTFHVEAIPAVFLISPDGKLIAQGLRGETIGQAVARALSESP